MLEDAYDAAIKPLDGCPLFTMTQAQKLINHLAAHTGGDSARARHTVAKNAYRLRQRDEPDNRIKYRKRQSFTPVQGPSSGIGAKPIRG
jgi:hypothetical protein